MMSASTELDKKQEWNFCNFLPQRVWDVMPSESGPSALIGFLKLLGHRLPCGENTMQLMVCLLLFETEGTAKSLAMSRDAKNEFLKCMRRWAAHVPDVEAIDRIVSLPADPASLREAYPRTYDRAYADGGPVPCKHNHVMVEMMRGGRWMRVHKTKAQSQELSNEDPMQCAIQRAVTSVLTAMMPMMQMRPGEVQLQIPPPRRRAPPPALPDIARTLSDQFGAGQQRQTELEDAGKLKVEGEETGAGSFPPPAEASSAGHADTPPPNS